VANAEGLPADIDRWLHELAGRTGTGLDVAAVRRRARRLRRARLFRQMGAVMAVAAVAAALSQTITAGTVHEFDASAHPPPTPTDPSPFAPDDEMSSPVVVPVLPSTGNAIWARDAVYDLVAPVELAIDPPPGLPRDGAAGPGSVPAAARRVTTW
jgi:hypothetical protein